MTGLPWSHDHIAVSHLKILEELLRTELRLTEVEVEAVMEYSAAKVEKDGSDSHGGQALNDAKSAGKSTVKSSLLDQQERHGDRSSWYTGRGFSVMGDSGLRSFSDKLQLTHSTQLLQETKSGPTVEDCSREGTA